MMSNDRKMIYILSKCNSKHSRTRHLAQNLLAKEAAKFIDPVIDRINAFNKSKVFDDKSSSIPISFYFDADCKELDNEKWR